MSCARAAFAVVAVFVVGCGSISNYRVMTGVARVPNPGVVDVAMENEPPPPSFTEIALVASSGYGVYSNDSDVIEALRAQAKQLGADAVVRVHLDHGLTSVFGTGVAVLLNGGPVRGTAMPVSTSPASVPTPGIPTSAPVVPPGYENAVPPPPPADAIPDPPS